MATFAASAAREVGIVLKGNTWPADGVVYMTRMCMAVCTMTILAAYSKALWIAKYKESDPEPIAPETKENAATAQTDDQPDGRAAKAPNKAAAAAKEKAEKEKAEKEKEKALRQYVSYVYFYVYQAEFIALPIQLNFTFTIQNTVPCPM